MRLEVRCCCTPGKLLGWIDWPDDMRSSVRLPVVSSMTVEEGFLKISGDMTESVPYESAVLTLCDFRKEALSRPYKAVKSNDVPIEVLRKIPGFQENYLNFSNEADHSHK